MQMPDPRAVIKFQMPHPRDWNVSKCPANARGGMGTAGIDWCITLTEANTKILTKNQESYEGIAFRIIMPFLCKSLKNIEIYI